LRHSFASVGVAAKLGLPIVGALLGHLDQSTTQRYSHLDNDPLQAAAELIGGRIDEAMKATPKKMRRVK
jgi:site-specific recombinase XerD